MSPSTGKEDPSLTFDQEATEIFHDTLYSPGSPYGIPRWIANLPSIMGIRESELTNLQFFKDNAIPAMAILISGGALSAESVANIQSHFSGGRGRQSMNRVMVLEASGDDEAGKLEGSIPPPRIDMKPLTSERQTDGNFNEYEEACEKKVRASFRLPPLFVGRSDDYSHATADASMVMADAQVFGPERNKTDDVYNSKFLVKDGIPLQYWRMRSNPPRLVSAEAILDALDVLDNVGAITPNIAIGIANELFDLALTPIDQEWGNVPFPIVMQLAMAGNLAGVEDIMLVSDVLEREQDRQDKVLDDKAKALDKQKADPNAAPGTPTKKTVDLERARKRLGFQFRQIAMRGNDVTEAGTAYKHARARKRPDRKKDAA
jgi:capsid portal protein